MPCSIAIKAALLTLLTLPVPAFAAPFDAGRVPADADGVGHLDMDALRRTVLHRMVSPRISKGSHWTDVDAKLRPLARTLLDVAQGVTFWLTDRDTGAVLIQVPDARRIQALLDKVPYKAQVRVAGHLARRYAFSDDDPSLAVLVGNQLIMADDEASLAKAINAATGKGRSLAAARGVPDGARGPGLFFFTALNAKLLDKVKDAAQSATMRLSMSALTVHVAEIRSELRVRARMTVGSAQEAQQLKSMAEGVIALASMSDEAAEARPFIKAVRVVATGKVIELSLAMPTADLVKLIESKK